VVTLKEKALDRGHPSTLASKNNLALVLHGQGKYEEAGHPETLNSVHNLACLLEEQQRYNESFTLYERAYIGYHTVLGSDHPKTRTCHQIYTKAKMNASEE